MEPTPSFDALLPADMARKAEAVGEAKAGLRSDRLVLLAVLAGAFIALGGIFSTTVTAGPGLAPGLSRLLGGLVFSLGLVLVVVGGAELFTGNTLVVMATASRRVTLRQLLRNWVIVYVGNFAGAVATAVLVVWAGTPERGDGSFGVRALDIAEAKSGLGFREAFFLGVLANALVCLAVWLSFSARTVTDKVLAVILPISAFVAAGFEHSVANMYFLPVGLFVKRWATDGYWATTGTDPGDYAEVTWDNFLVGNLLPVTLGNIVGGGVLVGLVYWLAYRRDGAW
jgi:formate transporter FocA